MHALLLGLPAFRQEVPTVRYELPAELPAVAAAQTVLLPVVP